MGHSLCSFILRQIPRRSPTHNAVYFTTTRLGGYNHKERKLASIFPIFSIRDSSITQSFPAPRVVLPLYRTSKYVKTGLYLLQSGFYF